MNDTKMYTVELTELEAAAVALLSGFIHGSDAAGTLRYHYESAARKINEAGGPCYDEGNPWFEEFRDSDYNIPGGFRVAPVTPKVPLNSNYTAEVTPEGIKVGCQTFPLSVIDLLVAARNKITPTTKE